MSKVKQPGEGNREADRRYREAVKSTTEESTELERAKRAREMSPEELREARKAEKEGKARKRSS